MLETDRARATAFAKALLTEKTCLQDACGPAPDAVRGIRALERLAWRLERPFRLAVFGEANAGKSSLVNALSGLSALPVQPVVNTRVPTLVKQASQPNVTAVSPCGSRQLLGSKSDDAVAPDCFIEVGLPTNSLASFEIMDFPGDFDPRRCLVGGSPGGYRADGVIWATVATQAWRESERTAWSAMANAFRGKAILAVTQIDLLAREEDERKLRARLEPIAARYFSDICLVSVKPSFEASLDSIKQVIARMRDAFYARRLQKAKALSSHIATAMLSRLPA